MAEPKDKKKKLKGFKEFDPTKYIDVEPTLDEAAMKEAAVITFGRMNPPTVGHEKLVAKVMAEASRRKGEPMIFLSHTQDKKKNPLSYDDKIKYAQKAFGSIVKKSPAKTIIQIAAALTGKYKNLIMVVGSDRVAEFEKLLNAYNGKDFRFNRIEVISAGDRDPDADDVSGMSASKMRSLASENNSKEFARGLPKKIQPEANTIMAAVRKGMNMSESEEVHIDEMEPLDEALSRQARRKRAMAMKRARFKVARGREKAKRRVASLDVLKKRARKAAINLLKQKFAKNRRYAELSVGEKEVIDKRVEKINKKRIESIAKRLLPKVKKRERERHAAHFGAANLQQKVNEASCADTKVRKRPHMMMDSNMKPKFDRRFRFFKKKQVNESFEDLTEELVGLMEATEEFAENYYKGVPKDKKDDREAHFKRYAEKPGDGADKDSNYKPAPGDFKDGERVKTKLSKHTKKYQQMYGEEMEISEDATASLKKKAEKTGMPLGVLRKVYNRGVAAWKSGHRPGTTPEQWGHARVNSFVTKSSGTWGKADADLAAKVRGSKKNEEVENIEEASYLGTAPKPIRWIVSPVSSKVPNPKKHVNTEVKAKTKLEAMHKGSKEMGMKLLDVKAVPKYTDDAKMLESLEERSTGSAIKAAIGGLFNKKNYDAALKYMKDSGKSAADVARMYNGVDARKLASMAEEAGAGEEGTDKLVKKYKKDTPNA